jgi:transcriptional regulator with XRE-family HTH domain
MRNQMNQNTGRSNLSSKTGSVTALKLQGRSYADVDLGGRKAQAVDADTNPHLEFGQRLRAMRIALGYHNASEFCRVLTHIAGKRISPARLNNIERGRNAPNAGDVTLMGTLYAVGIDMNYLLAGDARALPVEMRSEVLSCLRQVQEEQLEADLEDDVNS